MNVLSLFDGMSCGQLALNRAGIKYDNYYASEIDKHAMAVTKKNFPDTIHIGDITQIKAQNLPKIDLLIGGSPCQGFSVAGKRLNFEDPRSKLFFEYLRLKNELNPKYFLLENVRMKKEIQDKISELVGCQPVKINSGLVSAQNRVRLYWTNIPNITQPEDKKLTLKDILQNKTDQTESKSSKIIQINPSKDSNGKQPHMRDRVYDVSGKSTALTRDFANSVNVLLTNRTEYVKYLATLSNEDRKKAHRTKDFSFTPIRELEAGKYIHANHLRQGGCLLSDKSGTLVTGNKGTVLDTDTEGKIIIRPLTPIECERLQTVPDNYTDCVSNSQRYKMLGNGWTVDVVAHIFKGIE